MCDLGFLCRERSDAGMSRSAAMSAKERWLSSYCSRSQSGSSVLRTSRGSGGPIPLLYSGTFWSATERDHVVYESRLELASVVRNSLMRWWLHPVSLAI